MRIEILSDVVRIPRASKRNGDERSGNLIHGTVRGLACRHAECHVAFDIFDHDDGVIHHDALPPAPGYGRELLRSATEHAQKAGCRRITLLTDEDNATARTFYEGFGSQPRLCGGPLDCN